MTIIIEANPAMNGETMGKETNVWIYFTTIAKIVDSSSTNPISFPYGTINLSFEDEGNR